jgi:AcrR family transcriptional regulator
MVDNESTDKTESDDTRQKIIAAALELFGEIGYKRATTRLIAERAEINEVTLFRHFGKKQNLLTACVAEFNAVGFSDNMEHYLTGNYPDDIAQMARAVIKDMAERFGTLRLLICDSVDMPELRDAAIQGSQHNQGLVVDYFQRQIAAGAVRPDLDAEVLAHAFESLFSSYVLFQAVFNAGHAQMLPEETIRQLVDVFVRGTINQ